MSSLNIDGTFGNKYQGEVRTRPYEFGTDAIERQRVSLGESLIDADFEYGLQATKWQSYNELRRMPSFYEIPGTDIAVSTILSSGTVPSTITVLGNFPQEIKRGTIISVLGLANPERDADRGEGFFVVQSVNSTNTSLTYRAKGRVGNSTQISTSYTYIRRAGVTNGGLSVIPWVEARSDGGSPSRLTFYTGTGSVHGLVVGTPVQTALTYWTNPVGWSSDGSSTFIILTTPTSNSFSVVLPETTSIPVGNIYSTTLLSGRYSNTSNSFGLSRYAVANSLVFNTGVFIFPGMQMTPFSFSGATYGTATVSNVLSQSNINVVFSTTQSFASGQFGQPVQLIGPSDTLGVYGNVLANNSRLQANVVVANSTFASGCILPGMTFPISFLTTNTTSTPIGSNTAMVMSNISADGSTFNVSFFSNITNGTATTQNVLANTLLSYATFNLPAANISSNALVLGSGGFPGPGTTFTVSNAFCEAGSYIQPGMQVNVASFNFTVGTPSTAYVNTVSVPTTHLPGNVGGRQNASFTVTFSSSVTLATQTLNYPARLTMPTTNVSNFVYPAPYSYITHRPLDGGVLLTPYQPSHGATIVRQSKKVFRYQSGKGMLWSSGTLFCPNNDISSIGTNVVANSIIIITDIPHGVPQYGATLVIKGVSSPGYNGIYTTSNVYGSREIEVQLPSNVNPLTLVSPAQLGQQPRFIMSRWAGASVRAGCFEDQNGIFWEYDGQNLFAVRRSSVFQISGYVFIQPGSQLVIGDRDLVNFPLATINFNSGTNAISPTSLVPGSTTVVVAGAPGFVPLGFRVGMQPLIGGLATLMGSNAYVTAIASDRSTFTLNFPPLQTAGALSVINFQALGDGFQWVFPTTRFVDQLKPGNRIVLRGMTHTIVQIQGQGCMIVIPPFRGVQAMTVPIKPCLIVETRIPQSQFNKDSLDGLGPSGFRADVTKMQMIGIQYTWYGAGFIDYMMRGADGNWLYAHRIRNNNVNDESYMRTGNMPVRYELTNEAATGYGSLRLPCSTTDTTLYLNESTTFWPAVGNVLVDSEIMYYLDKSTDPVYGYGTLSKVGRAPLSNLAYVVNDVLNQMQGSPVPTTHGSNASVIFIGNTCTPSLNHWGSALLMDGGFDEDRGYFFNYQLNDTTGNPNSAIILVPPGTIKSLFLLRLAPTVSNGIIGDLGVRDLINRAQLLLQRLDVYTDQTAVISGILNPQGVFPVGWQAINSPSNGGQPSFAQVSLACGSYVFGSGERVFSTVSNGGAQNSIDLSQLKEVCNAVIGGNNFFPDGPDTLLIQINSPPGITAQFAGVRIYNINLFWTEAQA